MKWIRTASEFALCAVVCAGAVIGAYAQNTNSGDIRGTVTDSSGAVIPGATVTVLDIDKAVTKTFTSDGAGLYDTGSIVPDHYKLTFSKQGFQTLVRGPITVEVGVQGINAQLKVGSASEQVEVTTDVPLLDTEQGGQEQTLTAQTMSQLPQVGADWENFIWLEPGATGTPENSSTAVQPNGGQTSINGNLPFESYLSDGATTTLPMSTNSDVTIFETTAEVKISDSGFSAQYGVGNVVYNQITKGGTDHFHGAGYEYFQNNALNAAPYAFGQKGSVPFLRYNNFGFNVGGFVWPHKVFFFFDYDKTIDHGGASNGFETVPDPSVEAGNFSAAGIPTLYDPTTQTVQQTGSYTYNLPSGPYTQTCPCVIRKTFLSEYGSNAIPTALIDAVSAKVQAYYPKANVSNPTISNGVAINNYFYNVPSSNPFTKFFGRLDYDIASNNRLTISETESDNPATYLNQGICPIQCQNGDVGRNNAQVSDVHTFSAHLQNEARFGFTDQLNFFTPYTIGQGYPGKLGWQFAKADNFPNVGISNSGYYGLGSQSNSVYKEFVFDPSDVVTLIHGKHILHFGGEFLISRADSTAWGNINAGSVNFNGDYTSINGQTSITPCKGCASYASGFGYADFLLGQTNSWSAAVTPEFGARQKSPQLFVQDDIKLTPKLTVNAGLRWEGNTGWSEVKGNESTWDPTVLNPGTNTLGAIWYGTTKANGRTQLVAPQYNIWLPRVGFSWQAMQNTVLRGAFGIYSAQLSEDTYGGGMGGEFGSSGNVNDATNGICPVVQFSGTGATPDTTDPGCGTGSFNSVSVNSQYLNSPTAPDARNSGHQNVGYTEYHTPVPTNYQWTLSMERQFGNSWAASLAYVGNHGTNLNTSGIDINQVPESKLGANDQGSEPYPIYGTITGSTNNAISNYNALQAVLRKRLSYGLDFQVNYVWSHFLSDMDSSGWGSREGWQNYQNAYDIHDNYSNSNFDVRNAFKGNVIYELPFGKGRQFLNNSWALDEILGGWRVSSSFVLQTGNPMGITTGGYNSSENQSGSYTQFPDLVGNPYQAGVIAANPTCAPPAGPTRTLSMWYNPCALEVPANFTYGDFRRNTIYGPGIEVMNGSLGKTFDIYPDRGVRLEIRADAFNLLNHPSFGQSGSNVIGPNGSPNPSSSDPYCQTLGCGNIGDAVISGVTIGGRTVQLYGKITF
ncbi:MAG TPA: TonB-dependent receptor [Candidatus Aquilonibacter sp.]|nr:TonB-dependent receptor [Candidatus Aquilonibacter sp.]